MYYEGRLFRDEDGKVYFNDLDGDGFTEIVLSNPSSYKVYTALLTQSNNNAPLATVLENNLGYNIIWYYDDVGKYVAIPDGTNVFPENKTYVVAGGSSSSALVVFTGSWQAGGSVYMQCSSVGGAADDCLYQTSIEIRVYP